MCDIITVSYTHLDVYKRQAQDPAAGTKVDKSNNVITVTVAVSEEKASVPNVLKYQLNDCLLYTSLVVPAMLIALWAQIKVKTTFASQSKRLSSRGLTGAQAVMQDVYKRQAFAVR